jgi:hypothetical protein
VAVLKRVEHVLCTSLRQLAHQLLCVLVSTLTPSAYQAVSRLKTSQMSEACAACEYEHRLSCSQGRACCTDAFVYLSVCSPRLLAHRVSVLQRQVGCFFWPRVTENKLIRTDTTLDNSEKAERVFMIELRRVAEVRTDIVRVSVRTGGQSRSGSKTRALRPFEPISSSFAQASRMDYLHRRSICASGAGCSGRAFARNIGTARMCTCEAWKNRACESDTTANCAGAVE